MNGRAILLVEDEILIRTVLADILREEGYEVAEALNGDQALKLLSDQEFDLLITDVRMPGSVDGLQLAANWKTRFPSRPVLISSAHLVSGQAALCDGLITKPFSDREFLRAVEELAASSRNSPASAVAS